MTYVAVVELTSRVSWKYRAYIERSDGRVVHDISCAWLWTARLAFWRRRRIAKTLNKLGNLS